MNNWHSDLASCREELSIRLDQSRSSRCFERHCSDARIKMPAVQIYSDHGRHNLINSKIYHGLKDALLDVSLHLNCRDPLCQAP